MKQKVGVLFAVLICCIVLFAFKKSSRKTYTPSPVENTDTSFQFVVSKYSRLLAVQDSCVINNEMIAKDMAKLNSKRDSLTRLIKLSDSNLLATNNDTIIKSRKRLQNEYKVSMKYSEELNDSFQNVLKNNIKRLSRIQKESENLLKSIKVASKKLNASNTINFKSINYNLFIVNLDEHEIRMHWNVSNKHAYSTIGDVITNLKAHGIDPLMVTNAGMYKVNYAPQGLFIGDFHERFPIDLSKPNNDNFYLKPNGVFYIDSKNIPHIDSSEEFNRLYSKEKIEVKYATQSGPMLLINGRIHSIFTQRSINKKIRSGVGIIDTKHVVFAISNDEVSFYDFAQMFQDILNCNNALFLDGAISRMFLSDINPEETYGNFGPMISISKRKD